MCSLDLSQPPALVQTLHDFAEERVAAKSRAPWETKGGQDTRAPAAEVSQARAEAAPVASPADGEAVELKAGRELRLELPHGETLHFEGPASFTIHAPKGEDAPRVVELLRGKVNCHCRQGGIEIRTAGGVASVTAGNFATFEHTPGGTGGTLVVFAIHGAVGVSDDDKNAVVPAGRMRVFGIGGSASTLPIAPSILLHAKCYALGRSPDRPAEARARAPYGAFLRSRRGATHNPFAA